MDGLLPIIHIDELFPLTQKDELLLFALTSSSLNSEGRAPTIHSDEPFAASQMDGLLPIILIDELFPQLRWTSSCLLFTQTSSCLLLIWTSSSQQFYLTSSSQQLYLTSSYYSHGRALPNSSTLRVPTIHMDELFPTALSDELFSTALPDELLLFTWTSSSQQLYLTSFYYSHGRALPNSST